MKPGLPPTIAPAVTSPAPNNFTLPESSAAAMSNGPAKKVDGSCFSTLPDASLATTVSFTCWPTSASFTDEVTSTVATAEVGVGCWAGAIVDSTKIAVMAMGTNRLAISMKNLRRIRNS